MLAVEHSPSIPLVSKVPTIIIGMDVSHGSPGQSDVPSIAAVTCFLLSVFFLCSPLPNFFGPVVFSVLKNALAISGIGLAGGLGIYCDAFRLL